MEPDKQEPKSTVPADQPPAPVEPPKNEIKSVTYDGYTFKVNFDLIDDVENVELIDKIENQKNLKAIVDFLVSIVGAAEYEKLKAYFVKKDGRFKLSKLGELYEAIFAEFDPKG